MHNTAPVLKWWYLHFLVSIYFIIFFSALYNFGHRNFLPSLLHLLHNIIIFPSFFLNLYSLTFLHISLILSLFYYIHPPFIHLLPFCLNINCVTSNCKDHKKTRGNISYFFLYKLTYDYIYIVIVEYNAIHGRATYGVTLGLHTLGYTIKGRV